MKGKREVLKVHKAEAAYERNHKNKNVTTAKANPQTVAHISWDYAQAIQLPQFGNQPGKFYFEDGIWCGIFGVCNTGTGFQDNYVLQEGFYPKELGSKPENTMSMIYDYLINHECEALRVNTLNLMCDNPASENKHRWMPMFVAWLGIRYKVETIRLHFCVPGHTKMVGGRPLPQPPRCPMLYP